MALSTQRTVATAFITSGIGCRGLLPGDSAGSTVRSFPQIPTVKTNILKHAHIWVERTRGVAVLLQWESVPLTRCRRQEERPKASGVVLDGQVVENAARCRLYPIWQNVVVASHHFLRFVRQTQASWASQFGWSRPPSRPLRIGWRLRRWATMFSLLLRSISVM